VLWRIKAMLLDYRSKKLEQIAIFLRSSIDNTPWNHLYNYWIETITNILFTSRQENTELLGSLLCREVPLQGSNV